MQLFANEEGILSSNDDKVILTSQRIQMNESEWGRAYSITIFLENISSIEVIYRSNILFLVLGIISALVSFYFFGKYDGYSGEETITISVVASIVFFIAWLLSRKHIISIKPDGGSSLNFSVKGLDRWQIEDFMHKIQSAKAVRMQELSATKIAV